MHLSSIIRSQIYQVFLIFILAILGFCLSEKSVLAQQKDFNFSISPSSITATAGSSANFLISLNKVGSYDKRVTFSSSGLGSANFSPNTIVPPATINMTIVVPATTTPGRYDITVTGTGEDGTIKSQIATIFVPQPPFSLSVSPSSGQTNPGGSLDFTISANVASDSKAQTVMLSSSSNQLGVSFASSTIVTPGSTKMTVLVPSNISPGSYSVTVIGQAGQITQTVSVNINVVLPPDFIINIIPSSVTIAAGDQKELTVSVTSVNGFDQTVSLTVNSKLNAFVNDRAIIGTGTTTLVIATDRGTPAGAYPVTITAVSSNKGVVIQKMAVLNVTVAVAPDFSLVLNPNNITSSSNKTVNFDVSLNALNGFSDLVVLNTSSQNPSITTTLSTTTIGNASGARVTVNIAPNTASGTYDINVLGNSNGLQRSAVFKLTVPAGDFDLTVNPTSQTINAGQKATFMLSSLAKDGFSEKILLSASTVSSNIQTSFSNNTIDATGSTSFTISTTPSTDAKDYQILISGSGGGITKQIPITLTVKPAVVNDFNLSIKPDTQMVSAGNVTSFSLSIDGQNGFNGMVNLSAEIAEKSIQLAFSNNTPKASSSVSITVSTSATTATGNYPIKIIGTAGSIVKTVFTAINVTPAPTDSFSLAIAPNLRAITSNESTMFTVGVVGRNGFSQAVSLSVNSPDPSIQVSLDKTSLSPGANTFVTVNTSANTKPDVYTLMISGKSGSTIVSQPVILVVRQAALQVVLSFDLPPVGQIAPPQNLIALATELKPTLAENTAQLPMNKRLKALDVDPNLAGFKIYRTLAPAEGKPPLTPSDIVKDENLVATLPANQTGFVDIVSVDKNSTGNFVYSVTSFFGNGQSSGGSDPASTNLPVIKNPVFNKGTIFLDSPSSFIKLGATIIVDGMDEYKLAFTDSATQFTVAKKAAGSISGKILKKLIAKGATVQIIVKNPDGKLSVARSLTRPKK